MKKLYPEVEDVPQSVANRASRIIERLLRQTQVERARDLPEEARIRLFRELRAYFDGETRLGSGQSASRHNRDGLWSRFLKRLEGALSFRDSDPNVYLPLALCPSTAYCEGMRHMVAPIIRATARKA